MPSNVRPPATLLLLQSTPSCHRCKKYMQPGVLDEMLALLQGPRDDDTGMASSGYGSSKSGSERSQCGAAACRESDVLCDGAGPHGMITSLQYAPAQHAHQGHVRPYRGTAAFLCSEGTGMKEPARTWLRCSVAHNQLQ